MLKRSAHPEGNLDPDTEYEVGPNVSESRASQLVATGAAEWVGGGPSAETATEPAPEEQATEDGMEEATEPQPSPPGGDIEVDQNGSWFTIYRDGEQVEKVQGTAARDAVLDDLEG